MKKPPFVENQIYHIYNRGVEKRNIFIDKQDHARFMHFLFVLNDQKSIKNLGRQMSEVEPHSFGGFNKKQSDDKKKRRKSLIEILAFVLMPNHFHLMVRQKIRGGIVKFMQKIGTGYTMYFNKKYDRVGHLFQGRFKAKLLEDNAHFLYLPHYIHLNPLNLLNERGSTSLIEKWGFLEGYRWSSLPDYVGIKNFPSVTQRDFLLGMFGGHEKYRKDIAPFLKGKRARVGSFEHVLID